MMRCSFSTVVRGIVTERRAEDIKKRFSDVGCSDRFDLVEIIDRSHVNIRCKSCGNVFSRETTFLNKSKNHNIECRACGVHADGTHTSPSSENKRGMDESVVVGYYMKGNSATQTAKKFGMNLRRVRRIIDDAGVSRDRQPAMPIDCYPSGLSGDPFFDEELICADCGRTFTRHQRMLHENSYSTEKRGRTPKYCSSKCTERAARRTSRHNRRKLEETVGGDVIPLGDLINRDKGICQLCGEKVDINDGFFDSNGNFHVGGRYPTVDHVIPLAKGGANTWDNVQIAHLACNSGKRDRLEGLPGENSENIAHIRT